MQTSVKESHTSSDGPFHTQVTAKKRPLKFYFSPTSGISSCHLHYWLCSLSLNSQTWTYNFYNYGYMVVS